METALIIYTQGSNEPVVMDLYLNETIALQYSFSDIKDLKAKASYSRSFRIPATENNSKIFGFIENNTFQFSSFNPKRKFNAIITVDTLPVMEGNIQWKASYTQAGLVHEYEIVFFGNVIDFFKNIGDADFKNYIAVELQDEYPITINYLNAVDFESLTDNNAFMGLTDRGNNWVGMINTTGTRSIYTTNVNNVIKAGELTPFVKAKYIFNKIIDLSGFTVDTSASATLIGELNRLFVPFTSEVNNIQTIGNPVTAKFLLEGYASSSTFDYTDFATQTINGISEYVYEFPTINEITDPGNNVSGNTYTAPFSGTYLITARIEVSVDINTDSDQMKVRLVKTDLSSNQTFIGVSTALQFYDYDNQGNNVYFTNTVKTSTAFIGTTYTQEVFLEAGETIRPVIYENEGEWFLLSIAPNTSTFTLSNASFKCDTLSKPLYGNTIDWVANAPVMKCAEFMSALFKMFNLVVIPDAFNSKLLTFIPIQEYLSAGDNKDWSNKLDISKDIVLTPTTDYQARINTWTYKKSDDYLNNLYNTQGNRVYGRLQLLDPENDFATEEQKIEVEFGSTPNALIEGTDIPIPKFINENGEYVNPTPRILRIGSSFLANVYDDSTNTIISTSLTATSHYSNSIPDIDSLDFNFGQETPLHPTNAIPFQTLYQRFWNDYIANIYAPDARIMEAFFALEFADIYNFKYNDKIFIKDSYWRILEISDYVIGTMDTVKVKLMKLIGVEPSCLLTPVAIDTNGEVIFNDSEGNPQPANFDCCSAYGYTWDGIGSCYAFIRDGGTTKPQDQTKPYKPTLDVNSDPILNTFTNGDTNTVRPTNILSIVSGTKNYLGDNNDNSLIVGKNLVVNNNVGESLFVTGSNASVINKGMTIGGGGSYGGEIQTGIVHISGSGNFTNNTTYINLQIEGTDSYNIPTDSMWVLKILLSGMQYGLSGIDGTITGEYNLHIVNRGTTVIFINATTIDETLDNMTGYLVWDVVITGETFYPRVKLVGSATYPENDIKLSALTTFTQYHYE
jgi:hypothetical protein